MYSIRKKVGILTVTIAFMLVAIFATQTPLRDVYAAKRVIKPSYVSELIMITEEQLNEHKGENNTLIVGEETYKLVTEEITEVVNNKKTTTVVPSPIYEGKADKMTATYLAYKTTTVPQEAITDIKFMNMEGGWSFSDYDELLNDLKAKAQDILTMLLPSIKEYQKNYALASGKAKDAAVYAHGIMNVFKYDDNNENVKVGDLFLRSDIAEVDNEILTTLFMQSNVGILNTIYTALSIACSIDENGETFLDRLETLSNPAKYSDATEYNDFAYILQDDFSYLREAIGFYQNSGRNYDSFKTEEDRNKYLINLASGEKGSKNASLWTDGYSAEIVTKQIKYKGVSGKFETLYDLIMSRDFSTLNVNEYYPLIACMTEGARGTLMIGLLETVQNATLDPAHYHDLFDKLNQDDTREVVEEGISVFFGVNREIYEDHAVAMTTTATGGNKAGDKSWTDLQAEVDAAENEKVSKRKSIYLYTMIAAGAITLGIITGTFIRGGVSVMVRASAAAAVSIPAAMDEVNAMGNAVSVEAAALSDMNFARNAGQTIASGAQNISKAAIAALAGGLAIAVIAFIVTLVLFLTTKVKPKLVSTVYEEIPGMLCHYRDVYDLTSKKLVTGDPKYVYYDSVLNPFGVRTETVYGEEGERDIPESRKPAQDLYNWELLGDREWLCIYTTKDRRAGFPVVEGSISWDGTDAKVGYATAKLFETGLSCNLYSFYNASITSSNFSVKEKNDYKKPACYLHYKVDTNANYEATKSSEQSALDKIGSAINNGAAWGMAIVGLGLGVLLGIILGVKSKQKKK